jgi:hypothetical protein
MNIFSRYLSPDIHPDDLRAAINARIRQRLADANRYARNAKTPAEVERDLFIAWLASDSAMISWPDWLRLDVINFAADQGGPQFLVRLGKALQTGQSRWFDRIDIFILTNWRKGHHLCGKTRAEAVEILRHAGFKGISPHDELAKQNFASRIKRLGLKSGQGATS